VPLSTIRTFRHSGTSFSARPTISAEEAERRRAHVRTALAKNRLEGIATSPETRAVFDYIRGEIDPGDLVKA
jgi:hypothetical protein